MEPKHTPTRQQRLAEIADNLENYKDRAEVDAIVTAMDSENATLTAALDACVEALEHSRAAVWDSHYGKGISVEYANGVDNQIRAALEAAKKARG